MVNNLNVSRYPATPPASGADRKIGNGPLYQIAELAPLLKANRLRLVTSKARRDAQSLEVDVPDVARLLELALSSGAHIDSEWCVVGGKGELVTWAACDAYRLIRTEWNECANRDMRCEYFLKFAIGKAGDIVLTVSCHLSQ